MLILLPKIITGKNNYTCLVLIQFMHYSNIEIKMGCYFERIEETDNEAENFIRKIYSEYHLRSTDFNDFYDDVISMMSKSQRNPSKYDLSQNFDIYKNQKIISYCSKLSDFQNSLVPIVSSGNFDRNILVWGLGISKKPDDLPIVIENILKVVNSRCTYSMLKSVLHKYLYSFLIENTLIVFSEITNMENCNMAGMKIDNLFRNQMRILVDYIYTRENLESFTRKIMIDLATIIRKYKDVSMEKVEEDDFVVEGKLLSVFISKYSSLFDVLKLRTMFYKGFTEREDS